MASNLIDLIQPSFTEPILRVICLVPGETGAAATAAVACALPAVLVAMVTEARDAREGASLLRRLLPFAAVVVLGLILWGWFQSRTGPAAAAEPAAFAEESAAAGSLPSELRSLVDTAKRTMRNVRDVETAQAAVPVLESTAASLDALGSRLGSVSAGTRATVSSIASTALKSLDVLNDKAFDRPGVSDVLRPAATAVMDALRRLER